ncbi:MAG: NYN domain-containing protein [Nanoarchaeota archaeon]
MKEAIVFVDANNWYHNIKGWFKPSDIDIKKVTDFISKERKLEIKEIRWFVSMPSIDDNKLVYKRQRSFLGHLEKQGIKVVTRKLQRLSNKEIIKKRQELLDSWDLCKVCKPIVESSFLDIKDQNQKEKGIDVWIAIDMVKESIQNNLDCCVLISGDADFVPALDLIKSIGKDVLSIFVPRGYSNEIRQKFKYLIIKREDLSKCLKDYQKIKGEKKNENAEE